MINFIALEPKAAAKVLCTVSYWFYLRLHCSLAPNYDVTSVLVVTCPVYSILDGLHFRIGTGC